MRVTHAHPLNPAALAFVPFGIVLVRVRVPRHLTFDLFTNYNHTPAYAWGVHALPDIWAVQVIASKEEEVLDMHLLLRRNIVKPDGLLYKQPH